jgi:hypothetical protein
METHANVVEIVNAIKQNSMCIDRLVMEEHDREREAKWAQKKGVILNQKTGEIEFKNLDIPMNQDVWLGTYVDESEITIDKTQKND